MDEVSEGEPDVVDVACGIHRPPLSPPPSPRSAARPGLDAGAAARTAAITARRKRDGSAHSSSRAVQLRREELRDEIVVRAGDLDSVQTGRGRVSGGPTVAVHDSGDLVAARARAARRGSAGSDTAEGASAGGRGGLAIRSRPPWRSWRKRRVPCGCTAPATAHEARDDLLSEPGERMASEDTRLIDRRGLEDDQARPAPRPGLVIGDEIVRREVVPDEGRLVGGRDDPVLKVDTPEPQWAEQMLEHRKSCPGTGGRGQHAGGSDVPPSSPQVRWPSSRGWPGWRSPRAAWSGPQAPCSQTEPRDLPGEAVELGAGNRIWSAWISYPPVGGRDDHGALGGAAGLRAAPGRARPALTPTDIGSRSSSWAVARPARQRRGGGLQWPRVGREWGTHVRLLRSRAAGSSARAPPGRRGELTLWVRG